MAERKDLIAIAGMLDIHAADPTQDGDNNNKTDLELLQNIVKKLECLIRPSHHDPSSLTSNQQKLVACMDNGQFPDSLAFPKALRAKQNLRENSQIWKDLRKFNDLLKNDYSCRRQMLIHRLDCTVESFKWKSSEIRKQAHLEAKGDEKSHKDQKNLNDLIHEKYDSPRIGLAKELQITTSHLLALREIECDSILNSVWK